MKFSEVARRVTGFSCPIFGVTWDPGVAKVTAARRVLVYLEDRRVLFEPFEAESPGHCVISILDMRQFLTTELGQLDDKEDDIAPHLRAMRASCRKFLRSTDVLDRGAGGFPDPFYGSHEWVFNQALGELRGTFGVHIAMLSSKFGIDVEEDLATILPEADLDSGDDADSPIRPGRRR
ncbi:MAG TPA: DUF6650 family protein [Solirubrobacteraceae bacterium]|nr:DUF6650 family protein [Solirubrobacteraceae bacterium]